MATKGSLTLHGRFTPGSQVRLVKVDGAHVQRPGPADETVDTQKVDKDGVLEFKGVEAGERYFAVGLNHGFPVEVRLTGKVDPDTANHAEMYGDNGLYVRTKLSDGSFVDEDPEQHQDTDLPDGATWLGQHQVPKGTLQRSDTPRGSAHPISQEERDRAETQWRKQEPTNPVVEADNSEDPATDPARTSEPAAKTPAKTTKKGA
jgi:hypothetical protein